MRLEGPVSQLRAGPSERELLRLEEEISRRLANVEIRSAATAKLPVEPKLASEAAPSIETAPVVSTPVTPPSKVRHARRLIGGAAVAVAAGLAFSSYYAWQVHTEPSNRIPRQPAAPAAQVPANVPPETSPPPVAARAARLAAPPVAAPAPARATGRASPPAVTIAAPRSGPRPAAVTHTRRDEPGAQAAAAAVATVSTAAAPSAAAPGDCPQAIVALGLCASYAREGSK